MSLEPMQRLFAALGIYCALVLHYEPRALLRDHLRRHQASQASLDFCRRDAQAIGQVFIRTAAFPPVGRGLEQSKYGLAPRELERQLLGGQRRGVARLQERNLGDRHELGYPLRGEGLGGASGGEAGVSPLEGGAAGLGGVGE
jgi:hypothetical protein